MKSSPPLYKAGLLLNFLSGSFTEFRLLTSVYSDAVLETIVTTIKGFSVGTTFHLELGHEIGPVRFSYNQSVQLVF